MSDDDLGEETKALLQGYVEGVLTPAECRRLRELIRRDPRLARLLAEGVRMNDELHELFPARKIRRACRRFRSRVPPADSPSGAWIATAALAATFLIAFLGFAVQDPATPRKEVAVIVPLDPPRVARPDPAPRQVPQPPVRPPEDSSPLVPRTFDSPRKPENVPLEMVDKPSELPKPRSTVAAPPPLPPAPDIIARVEEAKSAFVTADGKRQEIRESCDLLPGQGLVTGVSGRAVLVYADGTRVQLESGTKIPELKSGRGKHLEIDRGAVSAVVAKQKDGEPMVFSTQIATATVLGTTLRVAANSPMGGATLLQVFEGKVRIANKSGLTKDVDGGVQAVATSGDITRQTMSADLMLKGLGVLTISFGPPGRKLRPGCMIDSGLEYDPDRGYGWTRAITGAGTSLAKDPSELDSSFIAGGDSIKTESWRMGLPKGRYEVTVRFGGVGNSYPEQGPHMVTVEGKPVVKGDMTRNGGHITREIVVDVNDGELTVTIGGHRSDKKASDNTDDTVINYLKIVRK